MHKVGPALTSVEDHSRPNWAVLVMFGLPPVATVERTSRFGSFVPIPEVTGESATNGQARDDHAASLLTLDLIRAADDAPSSDSPYPTSRTMRSFNG